MKLFLLFFIFAIGCHNSQPVLICKNQFVNDTIKKDIPEHIRRPEIKKKKIDFINAIGLCQLEQGFDSLQIRVHYSTIKFIKILTIANSNNKWSAFLTVITWDNKEVIELTSLKRKDLVLKPRSKWRDIDHFINQSGILNMRDAGELKDYDISTGGETVEIEISTKELYKYNHYPDLSGNTSNSIEAKTVEKIVRDLEKEFSFHFE